jgi:hypothetical protein
VTRSEVVGIPADQCHAPRLSAVGVSTSRRYSRRCHDARSRC